MIFNNYEFQRNTATFLDSAHKLQLLNKIRIIVMGAVIHLGETETGLSGFRAAIGRLLIGQMIARNDRLFQTLTLPISRPTYRLDKTVNCRGPKAAATAHLPTRWRRHADNSSSYRDPVGV